MISRGVIRDTTARRVVDTLVVGNAQLSEDAMKYPSLPIDKMQAEFLQTIGEGWAFPLTGFMNEMELLESMNMKTVTKNGERHLMSVPIVQHLTTAQKEAFGDAKNIALTWEGNVVAVINNPTFYENRKEEICTRTFGCFEQSHPMAENIMA